MVSRKVLSQVLLLILVALAPVAWADDGDGGGIFDWIAGWVQSLCGGEGEGVTTQNSMDGETDDPEHYNYLPPGG